MHILQASVHFRSVHDQVQFENLAGSVAVGQVTCSFDPHSLLLQRRECELREGLLVHGSMLPFSAMPSMPSYSMAEIGVTSMVFPALGGKG